VPVLGVDSAPDNVSSPKPWTRCVYSEDIENRAPDNGGSSRACHLTADHAPRSAAAGRRSIKPQQVDCKDGCQGLPLGALEHEDATNLNAADEGDRAGSLECVGSRIRSVRIKS